ncbi:60S ribosomal protein L7 [Anaeramoeba flamelloides]|uniref:60S ribosomal protein L7 n=1 Tax=Anaeramoeba flamelloides TaxID=1746091 RepID=A0ABQ8Y0V9_9EUKA|nr:60S ribosomal protein L7 [Anaeramoeba flamelloides]
MSKTLFKRLKGKVIKDTVLQGGKTLSVVREKRRARKIRSALRGKRKGYTLREPGIDYVSAEKIIKTTRQRNKSLSGLQRRSRTIPEFKKEDEGKLIFAIRVKVQNASQMHTKVFKILKLLRLNKFHSGVFLRLTKATHQLLHLVSPYVVYGFPSTLSVRNLIFKRSYILKNGEKTALSSNKLVSERLGKFDIICIEDLVSQIVERREYFNKCTQFLLPFKLNFERDFYKNLLRKHGIQKIKYGNINERINDIIKQMN